MLIHNFRVVHYAQLSQYLKMSVSPAKIDYFSKLCTPEKNSSHGYLSRYFLDLWCM